MMCPPATSQQTTRINTNETTLASDRGTASLVGVRKFRMQLCQHASERIAKVEKLPFCMIEEETFMRSCVAGGISLRDATNTTPTQNTTPSAGTKPAEGVKCALAHPRTKRHNL